jgi:hypothetical protein
MFLAASFAQIGCAKSWRLMAAAARLAWSGWSGGVDVVFHQADEDVA